MHQVFNSLDFLEQLLFLIVSSFSENKSDERRICTMNCSIVQSQPKKIIKVTIIYENEVMIALATLFLTSLA